MASGSGESTSMPTQSPSCSSNNANDAGDFECNICFELAQDPIVTLCGHLYCWPCLYRWLHHRSHSHECPVCKAIIQEEKLVPLYGRGKTPTDPRSKSYPGIDIPSRPSGQRPETSSRPEASNFNNHGFGFMGGFVPMETGRIGNFTLGIGGFFPSLLNIQFQGFTDPAVYGTAGFPYGINGFQGGNAHGLAHGGRDNGLPQPSRGHHADYVLKNLLLLTGLFVLLALIWW